MASIRKRGMKWFAEVRMKGYREAQTFSTKAKAQAWASDLEMKIIDGNADQFARGKGKIFWDALDRYGREVTPTKRSRKWEYNRIAWMQENLPFVDSDIQKVSAPDILEWMLERQKNVQNSTINRDLNLLSAIFTKARREWKWVSDNPVADITRPHDPHPRHRRVSQDEIKRIMAAGGHERGDIPETPSALVTLYFLIALETAMRLSEVHSITEETYMPEKRCVVLKGGDKGAALSPNRRTRRDVAVPLSKAAMELIEIRLKASLRGNVDSLGALFVKVVHRADIKDLHFHDSRHEALTTMAKKVDVLQLLKIARIRDIRYLTDVYYNPTASEIAEALDA